MLKQDERWENLEKWQYQSDMAVEALQSDIASLKTVTQDRLRVTEEMQSKLTEELHATREALRSEIFGELEAKFTTKESAMHGAKSSSLSAFAPDFVPSSDVLPGPGAGAAHWQDTTSTTLWWRCTMGCIQTTVRDAGGSKQMV